MNGKEKYMYILGGIIILATIAVVVMLILCAVPAGNKDAVNIVLGCLVTATITVIGYFYGSSKSSADKTELIAKIDKGQSNDVQ